MYPTCISAFLCVTSDWDCALVISRHRTETQTPHGVSVPDASLGIILGGFFPPSNSGCLIIDSITTGSGETDALDIPSKAFELAQKAGLPTRYWHGGDTEPFSQGGA